MKVRTIIIATVLIMSSLIVFTPNAVSAAELTYWGSAHPAAYNSSYWTVYPRYATPHTEKDEIKVSSDGDYLEFYTGTTGVYKWAQTNDYTDLASWDDPGNSSYQQPVGFMPPTGATITSVYLVAKFTQYRPQMQLSFSINSASSWTSSSWIAEYTGLFWGTYNWNVTSLATWTPELLNSTALWAQIKAYPTGGTHYYLDYLGWSVGWWAELEGGGSGGQGELPGSDSELDIDYSIIYTGEGLLGVLGFVGLIFMIATPPLGLYLYRKTDEGKMNLLVKMLALFMISMTLFMTGLGLS